jgi:hypothetical protein
MKCLVGAAIDNHDAALRLDEGGIALANVGIKHFELLFVGDVVQVDKSCFEISVVIRHGAGGGPAWRGGYCCIDMQSCTQQQGPVGAFGWGIPRVFGQVGIGCVDVAYLLHGMRPCGSKCSSG